MKRSIKALFIAAVLFTFSAVYNNVAAQARAKAEKATREWRYEIECAGIGADGTYLIKVWSYSKKATVAIEQVKKNAVHGVVFKGFVGAIQGCTSQKPLTNNPALEQERADFFDDFFADGGKFMKFVSASGDGNAEVLKVGKEYKVGVVVSVMKDQLRKDLEAAGIIKGLSSGF
jgi:hypothetical protein